MSADYDQLEHEEDIDFTDINQAHACEHVFHDGNTCMHVAPPGEQFCRWHDTAAKREERRMQWAAKRRNRKAIPDLDIPTIEDPQSLQIAIHEVMDAIIDGRLTDRRAGWLLYGLQLSRSNIKYHLHNPKMRYSLFNLIDDLEEDAKEKRANKKRPQSITPSEVAKTAICDK